MPLSDLILLHDTVEIPVVGGTTALPVYGVGVDCLAFMAQSHGATFGTIYTMVLADEIDLDNVGAAAGAMISEAPILAATLIAFGLRCPDEIHMAAQLPFATQVDAIEKIVRLTFAGESAPGKALEIVRKAAEAIEFVMNSRQPSGSGSTASENS